MNDKEILEQRTADSAAQNMDDVQYTYFKYIEPLEKRVAELEKANVILNNQYHKKCGEWSNRDDNGNFTPYHCTNCGKPPHSEEVQDMNCSFSEYIFSKYCPHCGTKMKNPNQ